MGVQFEAITYRSGGIQVSAGAASASSAIPVTADGTKARFVRLQTVANVCHVKPGNSSVAAVVADMPVTVNEGVILNVVGCSHIAYIREGGSDVTLNIYPLEF